MKCRRATEFLRCSGAGVKNASNTSLSVRADAIIAINYSSSMAKKTRTEPPQGESGCKGSDNVLSRRTLSAFLRKKRWWFLLPAGVLALFMIWLQLAPCRHPLEGVSFSRVVRDGKGELMRLSLSKDQKYRVYTRLADIPPAAVDAVLRYEDRYY